MSKKVIPYINAENELDDSVRRQVNSYLCHGAEMICIYNYSIEEKEREQFLVLAKSIIKEISVPVILGICVSRFEDIKKALYTGAEKVLFPYRKLRNYEAVKEASARFGNDVLVVEFDESETNNEGALEDQSLLREFKELGVCAALLKHVSLTKKTTEAIENAALPIYIRDSLLRNDCVALMELNNVRGVLTDYYADKDLVKIKTMLSENGIDVDSFKTDLRFSGLKKDPQGLVTVVVQEENTKEVLMVAYMNEEAYEMTLKTGRMTYFSRSRNELWVKGETSGHFQYLKSLKIDCDNDTLLAFVVQTGAACHTGNHSCFYRTLVETKVNKTEEEKVLEHVLAVINDRKINPKEGSYTNYLFTKGIDKILKKCGEEAAEMIIAAKNPDPDELKYEIADFLYHMMVLMAEQNVTWEDVFSELKNRE